MANPQVEDGHTKIANEIVEALARVNLTAHESRLLWCILRRTYGWHKKTDRISYSQFAQDTGMDRRHLGRSLLSLKQRHIIICTGSGYSLEYGLQKNYELWDKIATISGNDFATAPGTNLPPSEAPVSAGDLPPSGDKLPPFQDILPPSEAPNLPPSEAHTKERKHITKALDKSKTTSSVLTFEDYRDTLRERFKDLDFDGEMEKFHLYWYEGRRKPPANKKLALINWMQKARQISAESDALAQARRASARGNERPSGGEHGSEKARGIPGNRPAGAFDDLDTDQP